MNKKVCVEGNIGCGKSTALEALRRLRPDLKLFPEQPGQCDDILEKYDEDATAWALPLSLRVLLSYVPADTSQGINVVERSPMSARHVFSQLMFNDEKLSQEDWELYKEYCDALGWMPDVIAYIQTPADVCYQRMAARDGDRSPGMQYIKRLEFQYETMLRYADIPVVRIDGTQTPDQVAAAIADVADKCGGIVDA